VISYALGHGRRAALGTVAGVALGDFTAMTASMLGLGGLALGLRPGCSPASNGSVSAYLIYLGNQALAHPGEPR